VRSEPVDLADVVKGRADQWLRSATSRGVELEFDLQSARVNGVPLLLGELSENLVDNATRYGARNVRIETRREEGQAVLEVSDDGPGVAAADRARIFERFQRIASESTEGSGLGLAIVREIAQRHGAEIEVRDVPGARGVCVRVAFRVAAVMGFLALLPTGTAHAARPMITDDARIVDAKACQVESWARHSRDSTEYWALPACNPTGNAELTFGGARSTLGDERGFTNQVMQVKTLFRPYEPGGWGVGVAVGTTRHPHRDSATRWPGDPYFYVPFSTAVGSDDWVMHVNAGAVRRRDLSRTHATWGLGSELRLSPSAYFIPEVFSSDRGRAFYQAGVRYWLVKDRVQVDATSGNRIGSGSREQWFSVGLRLLSPAFLP
jgi:anti-sigma regulatory factor (Ser/Thr protein kinase)